MVPLRKRTGNTAITGDTYFDYGTFEKVEKPGTVDWTTVAEEISGAEAKRIQFGKNYRGS